ncbi:MAG TPA: histidine kinase, partial [Bacteroidia bacterium]|nr:histidine kinase [Bacteroidia bacterium]
MQRRRIYWISQIVGWTAFFIVNFFFPPGKNDLNTTNILYHASLIPTAIILTHLYRLLIIRKHRLQRTVLTQLLIAIVSGYVLSSAFLVLQYALSISFFGYSNHLSILDISISLINFWFVFVVWSISYYFYHYLLNIRKSEINSLKIQATLKEAELNKLKSQLNPHFMFNALNSIRALIDEDPKKAKQAVTKISSILRQTLSLEKNRLISFDREMELVVDYLDLEKIRFEERLHYSFEIEPGSNRYQVPPMILQTLVENAIKHGISNLTEGGMITIRTTIQKDERLLIEISNSGHYNPDAMPQSGYGIKNTRDRLAHVFADEASFSIFNEK